MPFPYLYLFKSYPSLGTQTSPCFTSKPSQRTLVYIDILSSLTSQSISSLDHVLRNLITYPLVQLLGSYIVFKVAWYVEELTLPETSHFDQ